MDPIDEFSFKPLTEGLGFHKKKKETKDNQIKEAFKEETESTSFLKTNGLNSNKNKNDVATLKNPLPKKDSIAHSSADANSKEVIDELIKNFKKAKDLGDKNNKLVDEVKSPQVVINPVKPQIDDEAFPLAWKLSPFLIDAMLVMALILSALMAVLLITKIDLLKMLSQSSSDIELWLSFPAIGVAMIVGYMSLTRFFLGSSLGEFVFDIQLGTNDQREQFSYYFLVLGRVGLSIITGFVVLPLISLVLNKDYLGYLSGLCLFKKKNVKV